MTQDQLTADFANNNAEIESLNGRSLSRAARTFFTFLGMTVLMGCGEIKLAMKGDNRPNATGYQERRPGENRTKEFPGQARSTQKPHGNPSRNNYASFTTNMPYKPF